MGRRHRRVHPARGTTGLPARDPAQSAADLAHVGHDRLAQAADGGADWRGSRYPVIGDYDPSLFYSRSLCVHAVRPAEVLVGLGRRPADHGTLRGIQRSEDGGLTWKPVSPILRSVVWKIVAHPQDPDAVAAVTLFGQVLTSTDGGQRWQLAQREFGEVRGICVTA